MDDEEYLVWYFAQQEEPIDDEPYGIVEDDD